MAYRDIATVTPVSTSEDHSGLRTWAENHWTRCSLCTLEAKICFSFIIKIINFIAKKIPNTSIILTKNIVNKLWRQHKICLLCALHSLSVLWATSHLIIRKSRDLIPYLLVLVSSDLVFTLVHKSLFPTVHWWWVMGEAW